MSPVHLRALTGHGGTVAHRGHDAIEEQVFTGSVSGRLSRAHGHWMPWPSANRPVTTHGEQRFVADLRLLAAALTWSSGDVDGADLEPQRSDVTAVLNSMRCGLTVDELFGRAPGLDPVRVLYSYLYLDARRRPAVCAWDRMVVDPSESSFHEWGPAAATLMSPIVGQLLDVLRCKANRYAATIATVAKRVDETGRCVAEAERALDAEPYGSHRAVELGRMLYDPTGPSLTNQPTHMPTRVGTLTPFQVATLLGERCVVTFPLAR